MTRPPFGFAGGSGDDESADGPVDPLAAMFGGADLGAMLHRLGDLMSGQSGPVNWQVAKDTALQGIGSAAGTTGQDTTEVTEAVRLADLWLDPVTTFPTGVVSIEAWSRRRWIDATQPAWATLVEPVAAKAGSSLAGALPGDMAAAAGPLLGMLSQVGGLMMGAQVGQGLAALSAHVVSATDVGVPLGPDGVAALVPDGIAAFGSDSTVPADQVRLFVALREAAHHRLYRHVPWLRAHVIAAVTAYADGITIDPSRLEELAGSLDPSDPEALARAAQENLFAPEQTPAMTAALTRLETILALVEGWVDTVCTSAAGAQLPSYSSLSEAMRRRRALGGPAEQTFASLVGLELRPRRLREAATLWQLVEARRGIEGRDGVWEHPDLLPSGSDLDDPAGWVDAPQIADVDISSLYDDPPAAD